MCFGHGFIFCITILSVTKDEIRARNTTFIDLK